jgi:hypothetical protein
MSRLHLPQITLCAVDTRCPQVAAQSLQFSMRQAAFGRVVLFTHEHGETYPGIEVVDIGPIGSGADYSHFVLRRLPAHVATSHVLVTQWDGFVVDARAWSDEFLQHDYLGAAWHDQAPAFAVGNGGFSLRSQRLLRAGLDGRIVDEHPEDEMLCRRYRHLLESEHGVRFAPPALARRFAFENETPAGATFGFHGCYHLPCWLDEPTIERWIEPLPDAFYRSRDARRLAKALLRSRMGRAAARLIERRRAAGRNDPQTRLLGMLARVVGGAGAGRAPRR